MKYIFFSLLAFFPLVANQTATLSPVYSEEGIPFKLSIEKADFELPNGIHSGVKALHNGQWLLLAGRTNGLHGFNNDDHNFPPEEQNKIVYVVDPENEMIYSRSLDDPSSGLSQTEIDHLSVTSPQYFQKQGTLYIAGGYGVDSHTGLFDTKKTLTALDVRGVVHWVKGRSSSFKKHMRQTSDPILRVTGGCMAVTDSELNTLLMFGQDFEGFYTAGSNGIYTEQVRRFKIKDTGKHLSIKHKKRFKSNPNYRRRDLNTIPIVWKGDVTYAALAGVFTLDSGVWTVPVFIQKNGKSCMPNPEEEKTFKQAMNHYACAKASLYDKKTKTSYALLLGGISFGYFENGVFTTDSEIPFINQITTLKITHKGHITQHLMNKEYPTIPSTGTNPGNPLLFGAGGYFIPAKSIKRDKNGILHLDQIKRRTLVGYIVGGIMSSLPNTVTQADSAASPYVFKVFLTPKR